MTSLKRIIQERDICGLLDFIGDDKIKMWNLTTTTINHLCRIIQEKDFDALVKFIVDHQFPYLARILKRLVILAEAEKVSATHPSFYQEIATRVSEDRQITVTRSTIKYHLNRT